MKDLDPFEVAMLAFVWLLVLALLMLVVFGLLPKLLGNALLPVVMFGVLCLAAGIGMGIRWPRDTWLVKALEGER